MTRVIWDIAGICNVLPVYRCLYGIIIFREICIKPLNPELNPICYLLALIAHHFSSLAG